MTHERRVLFSSSAISVVDFRCREERCIPPDLFMEELAKRRIEVQKN